VSALLLAHATASLYLLGLVWFVQVVHYPLFALVGRDGWTAYEAAHRTRTTAVVAVPMLLQLATAALLVLDDGARALEVASLVLVVAVFAHTFLLAVPEHERLSAAWDADAHRRLVTRNWLRTALWTAQSAVVVALLA
jgi:hypothetical protein